MADEAKLGTPWQPAEFDEIVADCFAMLSAELSGQPYSKSAHSKALVARIGRPHQCSWSCLRWIECCGCDPRFGEHHFERHGRMDTNELPRINPFDVV
jgi:hypothetical protein